MLYVLTSQPSFIVIYLKFPLAAERPHNTCVCSLGSAACHVDDDANAGYAARMHTVL